MLIFQNATDLVPWAAPNEFAINYEPLDALVRAALDEPQRDWAPGVPLLRFANLSDAVPLMQAITDPPLPRSRAVCDLTQTPCAEPNTLWVPCGESVVQVTLRNHARALLADWVGTDLVWC